MKTLIFALAAFLFTINITAQTYEVDDQNFSPVEDYYKLNYLNGKNDGKGNTGIASDNDISAVYMNPAALNLINKFQVNVQYTYKTTQSISLPIFYTALSYDLKHIAPSVYFGFGYKINDKLQAGIVYSNPGSRKLVYTNGFETVNGDEVYNKFVIHSFGIPVTYKLNNFKVGVIAQLKLYTAEYNGVSTINDPNGDYTFTTNFLNFNWKFGIKYDVNKSFSIGAAVTPGFSAVLYYDENVIITPRFVNISKYPLQIGAGIEYVLMKNKLKLTADYNFEQLSKIEGYNDKHNINLGIDYAAQKNLDLRFGFFTFFDNRTFDDLNISYYFEKGKFTQYFITAGFTYKTKNIDITGSILDSHISPGIIKNTYFNTSISYNF